MVRDNLNIRDATLDDAASISKLVYALSEKYMAHEFTIDGARTLLDSMKPGVIKECIQSGFRYHVAEIGDQVGGVVGVRDNSHLYHLFVAEEYQHQGLAKKLWQVAVRACLSNGNPGIFTVNSSKYALPVYKKLGFVIQSEPEERNGVISIPMKLVMNS